ncbi:MAG TPA: type II secretion system protein GspG [Pyrinomonadaceae bacterium]|nr:type II secretion system protein GspG [Pyrinomonadaceae bacterium]
MSAGTIRIVLLLSVLGCFVAETPHSAGTASGRHRYDTKAAANANLTANQARKVLTRIPGFELKSSAIRVKSVAANDSTGAEVSADIRLVFKFETDKDERWQVGEIRTRQDRWESIDQIARALNAPVRPAECIAPDPPFKGRLAIDPSIRRARCLLGYLLGLEVPSDALRIQSVSPMPIPLASQPSATVVAWVRVEARMMTGKAGWQVTELRTGNRQWVKLESLIAALNQEKQKRARAEMDMIAAALEKFRGDRGFYVVSDKQATAIDYLSPRYLPRVIRIDPWHQPYQYLGERDHYTLSSSGPDRKPDTADDISLKSR